jgi:integrin alpha FG-GAP repeat containing protein 1
MHDCFYFFGTRPFAESAGDIDMNGYVDLLVPLIREGDLGHSNFLSLWRNAACDDSTCGAAATAAGRRTFARVDESDPAFSVLVSIENAFSGGFFDINEQGAVGILVNSEGASGAASNTIDVLFNNLEADSLFLKAIGLNGVCPAWCATGAKFPSPKPYGVNHPGATFKFTVADLSGTQHARIGAQLPVSGPQSLLPPYSHHGLGRTNDYVQFFFAGFALTGSQHWQSWPGIIPNSQLVVFPFEPAVVADWTLELLVSPARSLPQVAAAIVIAMAALALSVLYFHLQEKRQDQQEKRKAEHLLTF